MENRYLAPSLFLNHGGGPLPVLGDKQSSAITESLKNVSQLMDMKRLKAIVIVTAHREEDVVTISSNKKHDLLFDYYNYPPESYKFKYEAPGDSILAREICEAFNSAGIKAKLDDQRGWDHGVFIPMMLANPAADIPIVQVSILKSQDSMQHYEMGKVLYQFRKDGVAIFGSGLSYHNMKELKKKSLEETDNVVNIKFDEFLTKVCTGGEGNRIGITNWERQEQALESHPLGQADHLMPLIVNAGAGGLGTGRKVFDTIYLRKFKLSGFIWDKE